MATREEQNLNSGIKPINLEPPIISAQKKAMPQFNTSASPLNAPGLAGLSQYQSNQEKQAKQNRRKN